MFVAKTDKETRLIGWLKASLDRVDPPLIEECKLLLEDRIHLTVPKPMFGNKSEER